MKKIIQELRKIFGIIKRNLTGSGENENNLTYSVNFGDLYNFWKRNGVCFISKFKDLKLSELIGKNITYLDIKINHQSLYKKGMPISSVVKKKGTVIGVKAKRLGIISYSYDLFIMVKDEKERPNIALINPP